LPTGICGGDAIAGADIDGSLTNEGRLPMPGHFALVDAQPHGIRILLVSATGETLATSKTYGDTPAAAAAVVAIREHAATAHIIDRTTGPDLVEPTRQGNV
jgi:uncharacterized protein YegP (UPF0339 family)